MSDSNAGLCRIFCNRVFRILKPSEPVPATKKEAPIAAEPISPQQPKADLHSPKQLRSPLMPSTEHDFKQIP